MTINAGLFFQNNRIYKVGLIIFDLILNESHIRNNDITQYNVEEGSLISDHIRNQLESGSVSGLITNFSLYDGAVINNKAQDSFDIIDLLWKNRQLVDIATIYKVYEQVAITNISINKDESTGEALIANFSFQEFNKVMLQEVTISAEISLANMNSLQNQQSSPNINVGKQQGVL